MSDHHDDPSADPTETLAQSGVYLVHTGILRPVGGGDGVRIGDRPILVGRGEGCDLRLYEPTVSLSHAIFEGTRDGVLVTDDSSSNGTFVGGGARVTGSVLLVGPGELRLGKAVLRYEPGLREAANDHPGRFGDLVGATAVMRRVFHRLERAALSGLSVLLYGETGTGKEAAAQALHVASGRRGPFSMVNCAASSEAHIEAELFGQVKGFMGATEDRPGFFQRARGGTLLVVEVGDLSPALQAKFLRAINTGQVMPVGSQVPVDVDVRTVYATHRDLPAAVRKDEFRKDLYFRIAEIPIELPPLRKRLEDLPLLVPALLRERRRPDVTLDSSAMAALRRQEWPGNLRELGSVLAEAAAFSSRSVLTAADFPWDGVAAGDETEYREHMKARAREYFLALHRELDGNVSAMARRSGCTRAKIAALLRSYGLTERPHQRH